jgi:SAM-dependent methyltransferase
MANPTESSHDRTIIDQFTWQASGFADRPELHGEAILKLIVDAAALSPGDRAIDLACGPGSVACALAEQAASVIGLDATAAMLHQARLLAAKRGISNVEWVEGNVYATPYDNESFNAVTCRFAFHHFDDPRKVFAEMVRLTAAGGRIVLCDGLASEDPRKAHAFNAMERRRDPSTIAFRTLDYLRGLFVDAGLGEPAVRLFQVPYLAADLVYDSFPDGEDRAGLLALIESSVAGDMLGMDARRSAEGVRIAYRSAVLSAIKLR